MKIRDFDVALAKCVKFGVLPNLLRQTTKFHALCEPVIKKENRLGLATPLKIDFNAKLSPLESILWKNV